MDGILKVTPEKLQGTAGEFGATNGQIRSITTEMTNLVNGLKGVWTGEAADAFSNQFNKLQDDMERMYRMVDEHVKDLNEMADRYKMAEQEGIEAASALAGDVIN